MTAYNLFFKNITLLSLVLSLTLTYSIQTVHAKAHTSKKIEKRYKDADIAAAALGTAFVGTIMYKGARGDFDDY